MPHSPRFARRRNLALLEAECLVRNFEITRQELRAIEVELESRRASLAPEIAQVHLLMTQYGITVEDLLKAEADEPRRIYRHPVSGESWGGSGPQPNWLKRALLQEGYRPSELLIPEHEPDVPDEADEARTFSNPEAAPAGV